MLKVLERFQKKGSLLKSFNQSYIQKNQQQGLLVLAHRTKAKPKMLISTLCKKVSLFWKRPRPDAEVSKEIIHCHIDIGKFLHFYELFLQGSCYIISILCSTVKMYIFFLKLHIRKHVFQFLSLL